MAEIVGLAASIVQLGGAGAELSIKLYNFVNSAAKADLDIIDLAEDLDSTGSALGHIGKIPEAKDIQALASRQAIDDAAKIKKRCELVFTEVKEMIGKRRKVGKDGKETLTLAGKIGWPLKEQRVELLRRRLDSLKLSLSLLLDVLKFAQGEAQGYCSLLMVLLHTLMGPAESCELNLRTNAGQSASCTNNARTHSGVRELLKRGSISFDSKTRDLIQCRTPHHMHQALHRKVRRHTLRSKQMPLQ